MAKFDWLKLLNRHRVPYNTRGPNTPQGAVTVQCPFCGQADPSDHMVIWPKGWRCWRNHAHRGKHPAKLVQALIRCSALEAQRITAEVSVGSSDGDLSSIATMLNPEPTVRRKLTLPADFRPFKKEWACEPFIEYLKGRYFRANASYLHWRYGLHYCRQGPFKGRVLFPVYERGELISYTGRTIYPAEELRYRSLTVDPAKAAKMGLEPAVDAINKHFLWYDWLTDAEQQREAQAFVLVEGPMDALKINVLAEPWIVSTCWMGSEPTAEQVRLLHTLVRPFKRRYIISDSNMPQKAHRIADRLSALNFTPAPLPPGIDDPGDFKTYAELEATLKGAP